MKGLGRILGRYVGASIGVGLFLLILNLGVMLGFILHCSDEKPRPEDRVEVIADGIERQTDGCFAVSGESRRAMEERDAWAIQLDDRGAGVCSYCMP